MKNLVTTTGECFCGTVKYNFNGILRDARSCHCSRCRKAFSAQASAYALVDADKFEWLSGEKWLTSYVGKHGFGLQFCSKCGSTLCGVFNGSVHGVGSIRAKTCPFATMLPSTKLAKTSLPDISNFKSTFLTAETAAGNSYAVVMLTLSALNSCTAMGKSVLTSFVDSEQACRHKSKAISSILFTKSPKYLCARRYPHKFL